VVAISRGLLVSVAINKLNTTLFGQRELDLFAGKVTKTSSAFFNSLNIIHHFGNHDTFLLREIFTADAGKGDGFVDASPVRFGVGYFDIDIDGGDNRYIVGSFLSNLLAVFAVSAVSTISMVSVMAVSLVTGLADSDHLDLSFSTEGHFDSFGCGIFVFLLVFV